MSQFSVRPISKLNTLETYKYKALCKARRDVDNLIALIRADSENIYGPNASLDTLEADPLYRGPLKWATQRLLALDREEAELLKVE